MNKVEILEINAWVGTVLWLFYAIFDKIILWFT